MYLFTYYLTSSCFIAGCFPLPSAPYPVLTSPDLGYEVQILSETTTFTEQYLFHCIYLCLFVWYSNTREYNIYSQ